MFLALKIHDLLDFMHGLLILGWKPISILKMSMSFQKNISLRHKNELYDLSYPRSALFLQTVDL